VGKTGDFTFVATAWAINYRLLLTQAGYLHETNMGIVGFERKLTLKKLSNLEHAIACNT